MTLTKAPVKGMKDILPEEMAIRDYAITLIKETYKSFGFTPIETPCLEHIGNLTSKQGGENESLIFKILKRGEKLSLADATSADDLVDNGLRYDLTVSLCRFYANNLDKLPNPCKALQVGNVWRADRPQKGRFRQFTQCDIDILGDASMLAEIELISATTTLLARLGFKGFTIRLNHRVLLKAMAAYSGFPEEGSEKAFIILDKMDKIGLTGVAQELASAGYSPEGIDRYLSFFAAPGESVDAAALLEACLERLTAAGGELRDSAAAAAAELRTIITCSNAIKTCDYQLVFDPTLVRGMGYYTGPIFEITMAEFGSSVGGGGRYDRLVGSFTNLQVPACGFSIGFERIIALLLDQGFQVPSTGNKIAFLAEKGLAGPELCTMLQEAAEEREKGAIVLVTTKNKNSKFQRELLQKEGYMEFRNFHQKGE